MARSQTTNEVTRDAAPQVYDLIKTMLDALDGQLVRRGVLPELCSGAAFEGWLAFEARLCFEEMREQLGVADSLWTANEYPYKTDLSIYDGDEILAALEFKLIYNNKNWRTQLRGVQSDLHPARHTRKARIPKDARWGIVGLVGKLYQKGYGAGYRQPVPHLQSWEEKVWERLLPDGGDIQEVWIGKRHEIAHRWLTEDGSHFFQLHALTLRGKTARSSSARR